MSTPAAELTAPTPERAVDRETYRRLATRVKVLSWASLAYMTLEGTIAILAGVLAGSVALIGFGIDSAIEGFASAIIVWRFTGARMFSEHAEQRARRNSSRSSFSSWRPTSALSRSRRSSKASGPTSAGLASR
jgi:hypothetical protein